ncbi:MAG: PEP-CTERM sorting domain-containing protein [Syntrophales bacterium]
MICFCGLFLLASSWCYAAAYSNLGPGGTYNQSSGWTIGYPGVGFIQGDQFSPTATATLSDIEIALSYISGTGSSYVTLYNDNSGLPGSALESWTVTNSALLPVFGNSATALYTLTSVVNPLLNAGTEYWLIASADSAVWDAWNQTSPGVYSNHYCTPGTDCGGGPIFSGGQWVMGAFEINGARVPEPTTMLLLGLGLIGLAGVRRKL